MEFNEKLQELRKSRELTQEQLAEQLYVSRAAISKWESGKGYPNIDSLKLISKYFGVSIDELLSGEELITLAETENKSNIKVIYDFWFGIVDLMAVMLIILPLYAKPVDGYIYSVNLMSFTATTSFNLIVYWSIFILLIAIGSAKLLVTQLQKESLGKMITKGSMGVSVITVLFLSAAKEPYATSLVFLLFLIKVLLLFQIGKNK